MSTIIVFVYLGLQVKWNQFSSNNSHHTSCIHKRSHAGKWPDLMTYKPDSVSTLGYHWTDHTGGPLEPQVHWDATGTTLVYASTQWCSSGDPVLICIIGTHWKTTGATKTLGCHWNHTGRCQHPVVSQWRSSVNLHNWNTLQDHWKATARPLQDHWEHTGISPVAFQCTLGSKFQAHWIATGRPLAQGKGEFNFLGMTINEFMNWGSRSVQIANKICRSPGDNELFETILAVICVENHVRLVDFISYSIWDNMLGIRMG